MWTSKESWHGLIWRIGGPIILEVIGEKLEMKIKVAISKIKEPALNPSFFLNLRLY